MSRRLLIELEGIPKFWVATPEDTILQKLYWGKDSQSEKQWRDVLGIVKLQAPSLDYSYLKEWAKQLNLLEMLDSAFSQAGIS